MSYNPSLHHRHSIRLKEYDYSQNGMYFITVCAQNRECLFGEIIEIVGAGPCARPGMKLNNVGKMIETVWNEIPKYYNNMEIDVFQIMPNHIHGIIVINNGQPQGVAPTKLSLPDVVHRFKTMTTKRYIDGVKNKHWPPFNGKLWQRNYYEHIIRNEQSLEEIREYIVNNPSNWGNDQNNPKM